MRRGAVLAACLAVAGVVLWFSFFRDTEEDRIRKTLGQLAKIVMVKEGDTLVSRTLRLRSLADVVTEDVRVDVTELALDVRGRRSFEEGATKAGLLFTRTDCDFSNLAIKVDPEGTVATVEAVAVVTGNRGGERRVDKRDVHFLLRKDGSWKVSTIDVAKMPDVSP